MDQAKAPLDAEHDKYFLDTFNKTQRVIHQVAVDHGWWERQRELPELIALCHSELSEMLEGERLGNGPDENCPAFSTCEIELADLLIRAMDMAEVRGYRLAEAVLAKLRFNHGRPYRHGGKRY